MKLKCHELNQSMKFMNEKVFRVDEDSADFSQIWEISFIFFLQENKFLFMI